MEIKPSARRHGIADADMLHGWRNQLRYVLLEHGEELQYLAIVPDRTGALRS